MSHVAQLRVRLKEIQRQRLLEVALGRGHGETLSDMVREAIDQFTGLDRSLSATHLVGITQECETNLNSFAQELDRSLEQILEDCVGGIRDIVEKRRTPLIVLELNLRRKYYDTREARSASAPNLFPPETPVPTLSVLSPPES